MTGIRDELGERLIEAGFATNGYLLSINHCLDIPRGFELPAPWNLPSRMFRSPIETNEPRGEHPRSIGLRHPDLAAHPFVQHVEAKLGMEVNRNGAPNEHGYSTCETAQWWHAVDLITAGEWRALLDTFNFTTTRDIFNAVAYGLSYSRDDEGRKRNGHISTADARTVICEIGADEPEDRAAIIRELSEPRSCNPDGKSEHWPINGKASSAEDTAWAFIFGIEDGWFEYDRSGHLTWSQLGRDRYAAGDATTYTETSGQAAFAF